MLIYLDYKYWRNSGTMSEFWNEELSIGYYDKIVKEGFRNKKGIRSYWHITTLNKVLEFININSSHLDYACGPGTLIGLSLSNNSIGLDISPRQIRYANDNYSNYGKFYTLDEIDFNNFSNKFDVVTLLGLIEFLKDDEILDLMNVLDNVLKTNGKIIITTPNFRGKMLILEKVQKYFGSIDYSKQHINRFNKERIISIFKPFSNYDFDYKAFLNISIIFSVMSHSFASRIEKILATAFKDKLGSLFIVVLTKKS